MNPLTWPVWLKIAGVVVGLVLLFISLRNTKFGLFWGVVLIAWLVGFYFLFLR